VIQDGMLYDPIQGQGHHGLKCAKMADFKGYLFCQYACYLKTTVTYDSPRYFLNFNWSDIWYSCSFSVIWTSSLVCSSFGKQTLHLMSSQPAVLYRAYTLI